jgi:hypothetical protein
MTRQDRIVMDFEGTPSDQLPGVIATGETAIRYAFLSLSARHAEGRDAEYIEWHSLDHRPEQYRLPGLRNALRLASTPECRALRAANTAPFDAIDHVMTYLFTGDDAMPGFSKLGAELGAGGRMPIRLPSVGFFTASLAGKIAASRVVAGSDVIPWRPHHGAYLMIEQGRASPADLIGLPGVAGIWWWHDAPSPTFKTESRGRQATFLYLDEDPLAVAPRLNEAMRQRWASGKVEGLLAAPFYTIVPFEWDRYLP